MSPERRETDEVRPPITPAFSQGFPRRVRQAGGVRRQRSELEEAEATEICKIKYGGGSYTESYRKGP